MVVVLGDFVSRHEEFDNTKIATKVVVAFVYQKLRKQRRIICKSRDYIY